MHAVRWAHKANVQESGLHIDVDSDSQVWVHNNYARIQKTVQRHVISISYNFKKKANNYAS